jgi:hypothetical protein
VVDLADINDVSIFTEQLGSLFRIELEADRFVDAELVEAKAYADGLRGDGQREAFSLLFKLSQDLPQNTYHVVHDSIGELHIFMTPVGPGTMESIFN